MIGIALALSAGSAESGVAEEWYLLRARANMKIHNYQAAIEAYRKAVEENPANREALRGLGAAYEANGQTDDAIAGYDRYLERYPEDAEVALKQARVLRWSRYSYRRDDAIRYYRASLERRDDPLARRELAQLLARDEGTVDQALEQYRMLLRQAPDDASLRSEYRQLLLWEPRHLEEALREYGALAAERPDDVVVLRHYARLLARDPRRTEEAIARYRQLLGRTPNDRAARLEYARALARDPSRRSEALEQLRAANPARADRGTRILYADLLAGGEDTRDAALGQYRALVAEQPRDNAVRLKYARLLGARQDSSGEAIAEYERVLAREPTNGEAHAGLAQALAWRGENDRALHHGRLARRYGFYPRQVQALEGALSEGREPRLGGGLGAIWQPGTEFALYGFRIPIQGQADLSAFVTASAAAGYEIYWGAGATSGAFAEVGGEARISRTLRALARLAYQSMRPGASAVSVLAGAEYRTDAYLLQPRLERRPRADSYLALVRGVTENRASIQYERRFGGWRAWIAPAASLIEGGGGPLNPGFEVEGGLEIQLMQNESWQLLLGYGAHASHHGWDGAGLEGAAYFSPALHAVQTPRLTFRYLVDRGHFVEVSGGPGLQYQLLHSGSGAFMPGGEARASAHLRPADRLEWEFGGAFVRMGSAYSRFEASTTLSLLF